VSLSNLNADPAAELIFTRHESELTAMTGGREPVQGWPVSTGAGVSGSLGLTDLEWDGAMELFVPVTDSLLWCFELPAGSPGQWWPVVGFSSYRANCLPVRSSYAPAAGKGLIAGSRVYAQPNPSKDGATKIRFSLGAAAAVTVEVFDVSGKKVFSFRGGGNSSENSVTWPHSGAAPGTYIVRVEAESDGRKDVAFCMASVIN
jgi:hypothetical protein